MKPFTQISIPGAAETLQKHRRIHQVISRSVPAPLLADVQFCRIENQVLRVTVSNAASLARLRFSASQIIDDLAAEGINIARINWHVSREGALPAPRKKAAPAKKGHDPQSAKLLESTANALPDDELRKALLKIAKHLGDA